MAIKPRMSNHVTIDWCHLCGERVPNTVDIDYAANAEHDKVRTKYIRICVYCADRIGAISRGERDR